MEGGEISEPKDTHNLAYAIHLLLGIANLLPWNAFITAVDYFSYLYPNEHVDKAFAVAYMGSSLAVLVLLVSTSNWRRRPSVRARINAGLCLFVCSLSAAPLLGLAGRGRCYGVVVAAMLVCGLADGFVGGSLVGSTGELPKRYMQAVFVGTASSGVLVSVLRIITKASLPQNPRGLRTSTRLYFIVSISITLGCILSYNILHKLPVMQHYYKQRESPLLCNSVSPRDLRTTSATNLKQESNPNPKFWQVWGKIRWSACGVALIYIVTLSIFPGYITEDVHSEIFKDWYAILLITSYNVSDLVGKSVTAAYVPKGTRGAILGCIARLIFYPLFAACLHGPKFFRTEVPVIFLTCALGLTNGFLTSALMIRVPKSVLHVESEAAGTVMIMFLAIGLVLGSLLSWFWVI